MATIKLQQSGEVLSTQSVPRAYRKTPVWRESSVNQKSRRLVRWPPALVLVVRQSPASKDMNMKAEEATALEAVTRRQLVKIWQTDKSECRSELQSA
jgi:hypothetical protein